MRPKLPTLSGKLLVRGFFLVTILLTFFSLEALPSRAGCEDIIRCNQEIERVKAEIRQLQGQANTLANQIAYLTNQIYLSELEIQAKQLEIEILSVDIGDLSQRLERIASFLEFQEQTFVARARSAYVADHLSPFDIILGSEDLDEAVRRIKYLKVLETQDREVLEQIREVRTDYNAQKTLLEERKADVERLKAEVEAHKRSLIGQRAAKDELLVITKGQEANYQQYLKFLEAERQSILAALRQGGKKLNVSVSRGEWIWPQGSTGCSTGRHIHYEVRRASDNAIYNPCNFVGCPALYDGPVTSGTYYTPGGPNNYLAAGYTSWHQALDIVSDGGVYASERSAGDQVFLIEDPNWYGWCRVYFINRGWPVKPYDGPAYGLYIIHPDGRKTVYWHVQKP